MKKISTSQIAIVFSGNFLGAGFVSGQELLQFFGVFGIYGFIGITLSILAFLFFGRVVMLIAVRKRINDFDKIIVRKDIKWLRGIFSGVIIFFLLGVVVVMVAGAGALLEQIFGIPAIIGNFIMCVLLALVAINGAKGVLAAFNVVVPLMVLVGLIVSVLSLLTLEKGPIISTPTSGNNMLIGNWVFAAISFVSYNLLGAISVLIPMARSTKSERSIKSGIAYGSVILFVISMCILIPLTSYMQLISEAQLPMLALAAKISPTLGMIYAILLFSGMFGAAISCMFAVNMRIRKVGKLHGNALVFVLVAISMICSVVGFKELIGFLYPICGYVGIFALLGILLHYLSLKRENIRNN